MGPLTRRFALVRTLASCALVLGATLLAHAGTGGGGWTLLSQARPPARSLHAMTTDTDRNRVVLFGGWNGASLGDTWEWDGTQWRKMNPPGARPVPRSMHALAYDACRQQTILYGGIDDDDHALDDTWAWDGVRWRLLSTHGPDVCGHAMAYDAQRRRIVLFGGCSDEDLATSDDTWIWNGSVWTHVASDGPPGRWLHAMAYDAQRQRVVLIGGEIKYLDFDGFDFELVEQTMADAWEWNGSVWVLRADGTFPPVRQHALAWDAGQQRVVMFGGRNNLTVFRQTREWTGSALPVVNNHGPSARYAAALAFDPNTQGILLFGGRSNKFWKDTWGFGG